MNDSMAATAGAASPPAKPDDGSRRETPEEHYTNRAGWLRALSIPIGHGG